MSPAMLPEDCISEIISLTSPLDAVRSSVISKSFKSASDSDIVWTKFLPVDHQDIISRSTSNIECGSKKDLYFCLCNSPPLLLDGGKISFSLDKRSGKKCYLIGARQLEISWEEAPWCWGWYPHCNSRFSEVAQLFGVAWLDIRGKINMNLLSPSTDYAAYLVFELRSRSYGFTEVYTVIKFVNQETDTEVEKRAKEVNLESVFEPQENFEQYINFPQRRADGWLEVEMGSFFNDLGDGGEVEARLMEIWTLDVKTGLTVEGIEFRPKCRST